MLSFGLDVGSLYYLRSNFTSNMGLFAHSLTTGAEQKLATTRIRSRGCGRRMGRVLWVGEAEPGGGRACGEELAPGANKRGRATQTRAIADGIGGFTGYGVWGERGLLFLHRRSATRRHTCITWLRGRAR